MRRARLVSGVWIAPGCIGCGACVNIAPEVFEVRDGTYVVREEAREAAFTRPRSELILLAAEQCPVGVIHCEAVAAEVEPGPAAEAVSRRGLFFAGAGWLALGGSAAVGGLALQRFMFPNVLEEPDPRARIGEPGKYAAMPVGSVNEDYRSQGIYLVRLAGRIAALSTACTHLGCIVNWDERQGKFKCPCHGSGYAHNGMHLEGPAPRPLERFAILVENGIIVVDCSRKFRQEKGEWSDPDSFLRV